MKYFTFLGKNNITQLPEKKLNHFRLGQISILDYLVEPNLSVHYLTQHVV